MQNVTDDRPAFLISHNDGTDPKINMCEALSAPVQWAWWLGNFKWYGLSYLKKCLTRWKYSQAGSLKNYEADGVNDQEHLWFFHDRPRVMIHKNQLAVSFQSNSTKVRINRLLAEINGVALAKRVLDFGCGGGINYVNIATCLPQVELHGIDYSPKRVAYAKKLCAQLGVDGQHIAVGDGTKLGFSDKYFDVTFTCQVLEQINERAVEALREMGRITSKKIILFEPSFEHGNLAQKLYINSQGYLKNLPAKIEAALGDWKTIKRELLPTYSNPLEPIVMTVLVRRDEPT